jgi:hypothetical protein
VTLAWDDLKAADLDPTVGKLENDLDLELYGPLETSPVLRRPWVLPTLVGPLAGLRAPDAEPAGLVAAAEGVDRANNVEQVEVDAPCAGTWEVRVKAATLPDENGQTFSLAADYPMATEVATSAVHEALGEFSITRPDGWSAAAVAAGLLDARRAVVIPARLACRIPGRCPRCERFAICPLVVIDLEGLPEKWSVRLIDTNGKTIAKAKRKGDRAQVSWKRAQARDALLAITPPKTGKGAAVTTKTRVTISARPAS